MSFEQYACRLGDLRERLTLGDTLHVLQAMMSGYEVLLGKAERVRVELDCCFATVGG
jgi:hypothetical protein